MRKRECYGRTGWNGEKMQTFANILRRYKQKHSKKSFGILRNVKASGHILMKQKNMTFGTYREKDNGGDDLIAEKCKG